MRKSILEILSDDKIATCFEQAHGVWKDAARRCGELLEGQEWEGTEYHGGPVAISVLKKRVESSLEIQQAIEGERMTGLDDIAEQRFRAAVSEGEAWAVQTWVKTRGAHRGLQEKVVVEADVVHVVPIAVRTMDGKRIGGGQKVIDAT